MLLHSFWYWNGKLHLNVSSKLSSNSLNSLELLTKLAQLIPRGPWHFVGEEFCPRLPSLPLDFVPRHPSSWGCVFPLRSSPHLTLWSSWRISVTSGLELTGHTQLGLATGSFCSSCFLQGPPPWPGPRMDFQATPYQGRGMYCVMRWLWPFRVWTVTCPLTHSPASLICPCLGQVGTSTPDHWTSVGICLLDFLMDPLHPCHSTIWYTSQPALSRLPFTLFTKEPFHLCRPPSTWFPIEATIYLPWALSVCPALHCFPRISSLSLVTTLCHRCSVAQLCLTLCDPMDCSTPGLPVPHNPVRWVPCSVHFTAQEIEASRVSVTGQGLPQLSNSCPIARLNNSCGPMPIHHPGNLPIHLPISRTFHSLVIRAFIPIASETNS